ncbi:MAG: RimK family alpha-L-glutamate ligase [Synergistaceae bacterium]|nr:RimK family alpha-L-glutamate ligase [Synergistaceae bacterium]
MGQAGGWHEKRLKEAFEAIGGDVLCLPITGLVSCVGGDSQTFGVSLRDDFISLGEADTVIVRAVPAGSLEQIVYRMDALHSLKDWGCRVVNPPETIERSADKFHASFLIQAAGVTTPRTRVMERFDDALDHFESLGGDVVLKPLFGSEGKGILRIENRDLAYRTFRALDVTRSVYYMQEYLPSVGWDLRVFVLGGRALGCIKRISSGLAMNVSRGAVVERYPITDEIEEMALVSTRVFGADYCGVDLYPTRNGFSVIEVNGIPGWRGFERATGIAVADEIAKWIASERS